MIKAIVFDLGGVVFTNDFTLPVTELCGKYNKNYTNFFQDFKDGWNKTQIGQMDCEELYKIVGEKIGISSKEVKTYLIQKVTLNKELKELILDLKQRYKIGILTNTIKHLYERKLELWNFEKIAKVIVSFKDKVKKPDLDAIKLIIKKLKVNKNEIIFIDDNKDTIEKYINLGIKCIRFKNYNQLTMDLKNLGI